MIDIARTRLWIGSLAAMGALSLQSAAMQDNGSQDPPDRGDDRSADRQPDRRTQDARRRAQDVRRRQANQEGIPPEIQFVPDVIYATTTSDAGEPVELLMDVAFYKEAGDEPLPAIIYIHGGGYRAGSRVQGRPFAITAARGGNRWTRRHSRLAQVAKYPAAVHDCKAAVRFLRAHASELGIDSERIGVWGHSAGGHLTALLATSGNDATIDGSVGVTEGTDRVSTEVACAADVSGPTDFVLIGSTAATGTLEFWFGDDALSNEPLLLTASPQRYVDADDPPLMIVHGTNDQTVPFVHAELLRDAATEAGISVEFLPVESGGHSLADLRTNRRIAAFFDEHLGGRFASVLAQQRRPNRQTDRPMRRSDDG